jgi:hypothetical protein
MPLDLGVVGEISHDVCYQTLQRLCIYMPLDKRGLAFEVR